MLVLDLSQNWSMYKSRACLRLLLGFVMIGVVGKSIVLTEFPPGQILLGRGHLSLFAGWNIEMFGGDMIDNGLVADKLLSLVRGIKSKEASEFLLNEVVIALHLFPFVQLGLQPLLEFEVLSVMGSVDSELVGLFTAPKLLGLYPLDLSQLGREMGLIVVAIAWDVGLIGSGVSIFVEQIGIHPVVLEHELPMGCPEMRFRDGAHSESMYKPLGGYLQFQFNLH